MIFRIYKITCSETGKIYIGSTCRSLRRRLTEHQQKRKECACADFIEPKIELLDIAEDREEALLSEKFFIQQFNPVNKLKPARSQEDKKEYKANWYKQNAERIRAKGQEIINCECGMKIKKNSYHRHCKTQFHLNNT